LEECQQKAGKVIDTKKETAKGTCCNQVIWQQISNMIGYKEKQLREADSQR